MKPICWTITLSLLIAGPLQAQGEDPSSWLATEFKLFRVYPRLDRAERFYGQGRYSEARELLNQVIRIDAYNRQGLRLLVETCLRQQDFDCATATARTMEDLPSTRAVGAYFLMLDAERRGDLDEVIRWGEVALGDVRSPITGTEIALVMETMAEAQSQRLARSGTVAPVTAEQVEILGNLDTDAQAMAIDLGITSRIAVMSTEEMLFEIRLLDQLGMYEQALGLAEAMPDKTAVFHLEASLLEKLDRPEEAADLLLQQATPLARRDVEFWERIFDLYGRANQRSAQINVLTEAKEFIGSEPEFLTMASILFLQESGDFIRAANGLQLDSADYDARREEIQRLIALLEGRGEAVSDDAYRLYRTDAEVLLIGEFFAEGDEAAALQLSDRVLGYRDLTFDQANSLVPILQGLGRCPVVIERLEADSANLANGQRLLLASCAQRWGRNDLAYTQLDLLLATDMPAAESRVLRKTQGYLALQTGDVNTAYALWADLLAESPDSQLALSTAYTAVLREDWEAVEYLLGQVNVDELAPAAMSQYWQNQAWLAIHNNDHAAAAGYYQQALVWDAGNPEIWAPLARSAERAGDISLAQSAWQSVVAEAPDSVVYRSEYAYFLSRQEMPQQAVSQFQAALELAPLNSTIRHDLVFAQLASGDADAAATNLRQILSESEPLGDGPERIYDDQILLSNISRRWVFEVGDIARLDQGQTRINNPGIRNSNYAGFGSIGATWLPRYGLDNNGDQRIFAGARLYWGNPDQSFSPQTDTRVLAVGARVKLFQQHAVFASVEQLYGLGDNTSDDTLFRLSGSFFSGLGWPYSDSWWNYRNLYLDAAFFTQSETHYTTVEMERGRVFRLGEEQANFGLMPFFRLGAAMNNDNADNRSETRIDAGLGLALIGRHWQDDAVGHKLASRVSLVFSRKIAGNTLDDYAVQLRINLRF